MGLLPKVVFVNSEDEVNKYIGLGYKVTDDGWIIRFDGTYHVFSDTIYVYNQVSTIMKFRAFLHEFVHAIAFRIPFHLPRELINWLADATYFQTAYHSNWFEYVSYFRQFRDDYGRFEWIRPQTKDIVEWAKLFEKDNTPPTVEETTGSP